MFIIVRHNGRPYRLMIEKIYQSEQVIRFRITGKNKSLVLQSNEPLLRNRGLKQRRPDWKLIEGNINYSYFLETLFALIEDMQKRNVI